MFQYFQVVKCIRLVCLNEHFWILLLCSYGNWTWVYCMRLYWVTAETGTKAERLSITQTMPLFLLPLIMYDARITKGCGKDVDGISYGEMNHER